MSLKVANTIVITDDLRGRFANTTFTGGAYLVMPEDPSVEFQFQGTISGYIAGGDTVPRASIQKFPFASSTNATEVGVLTQLKIDPSMQSSQSHGYTAAGFQPDGPTSSNVIDKFPFATDAGASDVGDISQSKESPSGHSSLFNSYGYSASGNLGPSFTQQIDRFPFASDTNSVKTGDTTSPGRYRHGGHSSDTKGYMSGALVTSPSTAVTNVIESFSFVNDIGDGGDVGDLGTAVKGPASISSETHGYAATGGSHPAGTYNTINQKFSFVTDGNSSNVGSLNNGRDQAYGVSSTTHGFVAGGKNPSAISSIERFPYASDSENASEVGDLVAARTRGSEEGSQR